MFTGWDFARADQGKHYYCEAHRKSVRGSVRGSVQAPSKVTPRPPPELAGSAEGSAESGAEGGAESGAESGDENGDKGQLGEQVKMGALQVIVTAPALQSPVLPALLRHNLFKRVCVFHPLYGMGCLL